MLEWNSKCTNEDWHEKDCLAKFQLNYCQNVGIKWVPHFFQSAPNFSRTRTQKWGTLSWVAHLHDSHTQGYQIESALSQHEKLFLACWNEIRSVQMKIDIRKTVWRNFNSIAAKMWEWNECPTFGECPKRLQVGHSRSSDKFGALLPRARRCAHFTGW